MFSRSSVVVFGVAILLAGGHPVSAQRRPAPQPTPPGKVADAGLETLATIERTPVEGETPKTPVALIGVGVEKR